MTNDERLNLSRRGDVFTAPMPEHVAKIHSAYKAACRGMLYATSERIALEKELRELESDEDVNVGAVLVGLHRRREICSRLAELEGVIAEHENNERVAVEIAEASRAAGAMFATTGLSASSTHVASLLGLRQGFEKIDVPLDDADRARIARRRR